MKQFGRLYDDRLKTTVRVKTQDHPPRYGNEKLSVYCNFVLALYDISQSGRFRNGHKNSPNSQFNGMNGDPYGNPSSPPSFATSNKNTEMLNFNEMVRIHMTAIGNGPESR